MKNFFNKKGSGDWNNDRKRGDGDRGGRSNMYRAICGDCDAPCEVPFKPNGRKPVLCSDCFRKDGGGSSSPRYESRGKDRQDSFNKPSYRNTPRDNSGEILNELKKLNSKIDHILDAIADFEEEEDDE